MLLLDRLPLHCWTDHTRPAPVQHWSVRIPVILSPAGSPPPPAATPQPWVLDTGFSGEAFAWRHHLETAGLDPDRERGIPLSLRWTATGQRAQVPVREADLWIVSNRSGVGPFCLPLDGGVAFIDQRIAMPDPEFHRALIGMRVLRRARLTMEIDFASSTVSIQTPSAADRPPGRKSCSIFHTMRSGKGRVRLDVQPGVEYGLLVFLPQCSVVCRPLTMSRRGPPPGAGGTRVVC